MGTMGRRPTPTRLKELRGTDRPDRVSPHEPTPEPGPVQMPRGVLSESARKAWRAWAPELEALGLLTPVDAPLFMVACAWAGVAVDAAREIREGGILQEDERGRMAKARALTILRAASSELRQLSRGFGLMPADRAGLSGDPEDEESLADQLFALVHVEGEVSHGE